ncbi:MAG: 4Fe-4S cluster-binding domain-containing protein [Candidatus Aminicenantes bacterium]|nr:4Fe-4S cluster-binding domain-containing protein [Candidatus Aminicenantes bacterium]
MVGEEIQAISPLGYPLIHTFKTNGSFFLLDTSTSSALEIDNIAYQYLKNSNGNSSSPKQNNSINKFSQSEINSVKKEFNQLKNQGLFQYPKAQKPEPTPEQITSYRPYHFVLIVTQKCNLRCGYCYETKTTNPNHKINMPLETAYKAIDFLLSQSNRKKCGLTFFGGEPLINFSLIKKVVRYAKRKAQEVGKTFYFNITTNGTLLPSETIRFITREKFNLLVSFDGPEKINDHYRIFPNGKGSHQIILRNIKRLQAESDIHFSVRATLTRQCTSLMKLYHYFADEKIPKAYIQPVSSLQNHKTYPPFHLKKNDVHSLLKEYEKLAELILKKHKDKKAVVVNPFKDYLELIHESAVRHISCGVCRGMMAIGTDGLIYPCQRFVGMKNFTIGDFDQGIDVPKILHIFQKFHEARNSCKSCWAFNICAGGCMHDWAKEDGNFKKQDETRCTITKKLIELSIYLYARIMEKN